ncbi:MAG: glycosyltransferase family 2 protein [Chitinophagales bacterium]|nr:glycosyltransferase family 2 protein [Chitinophagales bacterium]
MIKLSVAIIAFNEEKNLPDCLLSVKDVADEIVVVDSNSTDKTEEIAVSLGAKVIQKPFHSYVDQKNFATESTSFQYVLSIDADERLSPELIQSILEVKKTWGCSAYSMNRKNYYSGQWIRYGGWYPDIKVRLFEKAKARWTGKILHESLMVHDGEKVCHLNGDLLHYTYSSLADHKKRSEKYARLAALANVDRSLYSLYFKMILSPSFRFFKQYILQFGYLDGVRGWYIAKISFLETYRKYRSAINLKLAK